MVSKSKSTLKASKIEKYIKKKYNPTEYKVNFFDRNESINIQIETVSKKKGFKVVTPIILEEEDIIKIAQKILKKKDITASEFKISITLAKNGSN